LVHQAADATLAPGMHLLGAFLAGLLVATVTTPAGVSGAVLLLPVQVSVLGVPSPSVTPTNLIFNLFATPSGVLRYRRLRRGTIVSPLAVRLLAGTAPGVVAGAVIRVEWLSGQQAFYLAAGAVLAILGAMLLVRRPSAADRPLPLAAVPPIAAGVGVVGGIYGIGGGSFLAPILILGGYTAFTVAPAALLSTLAASVVGVVTFVVLGATSDAAGPISPDWGVGVAAGAGGVIGAYAGASLQSRIPEPLLRRLLGSIALVIAARYLYLGAAG
jgi:uncharacterized membrane protein YfcA